jgi:hypothetical protein
VSIHNCSLLIFASVRKSGQKLTDGGHGPEVVFVSPEELNQRKPKNRAATVVPRKNIAATVSCCVEKKKYPPLVITRIDTKQ